MLPLRSDEYTGGNAIFAWSRESERRAATYEITLWDNGSISCTCGGWIFKRKNNLEKHGHNRWCTHVAELWYDAGLRWAAFQTNGTVGEVLQRQPEVVRSPRGRSLIEEKPMPLRGKRMFDV